VQAGSRHLRRSSVFSLPCLNCASETGPFLTLLVSVDLAAKNTCDICDLAACKIGISQKNQKGERGGKERKAFSFVPAE